MSAMVRVKAEYKEFIDSLDIGHGKYNIRTVFQDLILMATIAIKNRYDYSQEDEDIYLRIMNKYEKKEQEQIIESLAKLAMLYITQKEMSDILGEIYSNIGLADETKAQYFTPFNISRAIGRMMNEHEIEELKCKDFITVYDPCCGSGSMTLGYVEAIKNKMQDFSEKVVFFARDIDFNCVCMTFIQFTMNGIPAEIILGNSLLDEKKKILYTPEFVNKKWFEKLNNRGKEKCTKK